MTMATCGTLVVMDCQMELLSRSWCMFEAWASVYYGDCQRLHVVFPGVLVPYSDCIPHPALGSPMHPVCRQHSASMIC